MSEDAAHPISLPPKSPEREAEIRELLERVRRVPARRSHGRERGIHRRRWRRVQDSDLLACRRTWLPRLPGLRRAARRGAGRPDLAGVTRGFAPARRGPNTAHIRGTRVAEYSNPT